ncbi:MAG: serine protease [Desulfobacteraceae bacterium]|nr:MAG: serine protease [Desulfobacteraceae bacterium]
MGDDHLLEPFDPSAYYPALALIRIPSDPESMTGGPGPHDDFGTGFFVSENGILVTAAHNLTIDGTPDGPLLKWVWVCCYDENRKNWSRAYRVGVDGKLRNEKIDAVAVRVPCSVSAPIPISKDWLKEDSVAVLGFQPGADKGMRHAPRWLMCHIPTNWPVAPFDLADSDEPVLRLGIISDASDLRKMQQKLGRGISGGPVLNRNLSNSPAIAVLKAIVPEWEERPAELLSTTLWWFKETLDNLPELEQIGWPHRRRRSASRKRLALAAAVAAFLAIIFFTTIAAPPAPGISITRPARSGKHPSKDAISGQVRVSNPSEYKVVVFSYTDMWYVQPSQNAPHTDIRPTGLWMWKWSKGRWDAEIFCGTKYAALLVERSYKPPDMTDRLPLDAKGVLSSDVVSGR